MVKIKTLLKLGYEDTSKIFLAEYDKGQLYIIEILNNDIVKGKFIDNDQI